MFCCCAENDTSKLVEVAAFEHNEAPDKMAPEEEAAKVVDQEEPAREEPPPPEPVKEAEEAPPVLQPSETNEAGSEVEITITREKGAAWGMSFEFTGPFLRIVSITAGLVAKYNEGADEKAQLRAQDYIKSLNNKVMPAKEMAEVLKDADLLSMTFKVGRAEQMTHQIEQRDDGLGVSLQYEDNQKVLMVKKIVEGGAAHEYNKGREPQAQLCPDDLIVGCNGMKDATAKEIMEVLKAKPAKQIDLEVHRVEKLAGQ